MSKKNKNEPKVLVVGYSPHLKGGVSHVTRVLMQNFNNMELHPSLYCYSPKYKAVALYLYSVLTFALKIVFCPEKKPDFIILIIGSTGDIVRVIPFAWVSSLLKISLCAQYHKSGDIILAGIKQEYLRRLIFAALKKIAIHAFLSKRLQLGFEEIVPFPVKSVVIPNAVEQKWLDIAPLPFNKRSRDVVFFGRWSAEKGVDDLVQCMGQIPGKITCEIYSNHVPKKSLRNCKVFPWVKEAEVMEIMRTAKLLVLPSYAEAYPTVLLEAAACGTPFVASDLPGILDIAEQSKGGEVFEKGNVTVLQKSIEKILSDKDKWLEMSMNGKAWVRNLSETQIKEQWVGVGELLASGSVFCEKPSVR